MACPSTGPDGVVIGDSLYTVFTNGDSGTMRTYISRSNYSFASVGNIDLLTGNIPGLSSQNYPRIDKYGTAMAVAWTQTVGSTDELPLLFTSNYLSGLPSQYDTISTGNIANTDVALSNGTVFVVWQDDNSGTVRYRKGTFVPANNSVNEISSSTLSVYPNPVTDILRLKLSSPAPFTVEIVNNLGETVITSVNLSDIDLSGVSKGIYFLRLAQEEKVFVEKIVRW